MSKELNCEIANVRFGSIDGLRVYACIGIVIMHVLANIPQEPNMGILTNIIIYFSNFVFLFMIISAFSLCCGYYEKIKQGTITPQQFYSRRYKRVIPFFALMVCIDAILHPSLNTFYEAFANLTLCFNLLPNPNIEVIGVGWFIGIVFTFYLLFPFFVFLLDNLKKAWVVLLLSLVFSIIAIVRFEPIDRKNIIYSAPFFISGGLCYLYKDVICRIVKKYSKVILLLCICISLLKFTPPPPC